MGMNKEYERRMKEEQEIHEQVKSELEEYNKYIAGLMIKKVLGDINFSIWELKFVIINQNLWEC